MVKLEVKKEKYDLLEPIIIKEFLKEKHEFYYITFERILKHPDLLGKDISPAIVQGAWRYIKYNLNSIVSRYNLSEEEQRLLRLKSTAFATKRRVPTTFENSNKSITETEKELLLSFIIENKDKYLKEIFKDAESILGRSSKSLYLIWQTDLRINYKKYLKDVEEYRIIESKISRSSSKTEHITLNEKELNYEFNNKRKAYKNSNTEKAERGIKMTKKQKPNNEIKETHTFDNTTQESSYLFCKVNDNEYEIIRGRVLLDEDTINKFLRNEDSVTVLNEEGDVIARNFIL